jgi:crossover junction endodeoxyribonuclease RuvC
VRILGVDCGSEATGFGLVESDGFHHRAIEFGAIRATRQQTFPERLDQIHRQITQLILDHCPNCVAIEDVFYAKNARSALKLGHVRGVVMQAAAAQALPVAEYTPLKVKNTVTGFGGADKRQVQHMVTILLALQQQPRSLDASDALAVAICHAQHAGGAFGSNLRPNRRGAVKLRAAGNA